MKDFIFEKYDVIAYALVVVATYYLLKKEFSRYDELVSKGATDAVLKIVKGECYSILRRFIYFSAVVSIYRWIS